MKRFCIYQINEKNQGGQIGAFYSGQDPGCSWYTNTDRDSCT